MSILSSYVVEIGRKNTVLNHIPENPNAEVHKCYIKFYELLQSFRCQKVYIKEVWYWGPTNMKHHCTKFIVIRFTWNLRYVLYVLFFMSLQTYCKH